MLCDKCKKEGEFKTKGNGIVNKNCNSCLEVAKKKREKHKDKIVEYRENNKEGKKSI